MQNLKSTEQILYRGVDWLRIGYYLITDYNNSYNEFLEKLKDIVRFKEHEERIIEIPAIPPLEEKITFRVKTTANIYPYVVMLVYEPTEIAIKLGKPLTEKQLWELKEGYTPTPNILINLPGKALRPQKYHETLTVLKTIFYFLADLGAFPIAFTFSRIDYAVDFPEKEEAFNLLQQFEKLRKIKIQTEEKQIIINKTVKSVKEKLLELPNIKHIGIGDPRRLLIVYYLKTDADKFLQEIYFQQEFPYKDQYPHRIEIRMNSSFFTENRKIYNLNDIEEATNLYNIVKLATETVKEKIPQLKPYMETPHPLFPEEHQYFQVNDTPILEEGRKITKKLSLQEEALRLLSQLIRIKENWKTEPQELIITLKEMILKSHPKIVKKAKEKKLQPEELYKLISNLCK